MATRKTTATKTKMTKSRKTSGTRAYEAYRRNARRHPFLRERDAEGMWLVIRLDLYNVAKAARGQYYPSRVDDADLPSNKALWPTGEQARLAAEWAAKEFGHVYGVFRMTQVVEREQPPVRVSVVV